MILPVALLLVLLGGSLVYCVLIVVAARKYLAVRPSAERPATPVSILKPLAGFDEGLEENLRSFFSQDYPEFEILLAVHRSDDPALAVIEKIRSEFPAGPPARTIITGEPPGPNAKAYSLGTMMAAARYDLLVMSDSDVRVSSDFLTRIVPELESSGVGMVTCPYRAVAGRSIWSQLEALGMNTEFLGGVLVARLLEGMKFALGPTIAARREVLDRMDGFRHLAEFLAEDFVMGNLAARMGYGVVLSSYVIEHRIGSQPLLANLWHRLRWARGTRRSRPAGYVGQVFTYPLPLACLVSILEPQAWPLLVVTVLFRAAAAWAAAHGVLRDPLTWKGWGLLAWQDFLSFFVWIAGFFGNTIQWRGRTCRVLRDQRIKLVS